MLNENISDGINKIECENISNLDIYEQIINLLLEITHNSFAVHKNEKVFNEEKELLENAKKNLKNSPLNNELPESIKKILINQSTKSESNTVPDIVDKSKDFDLFATKEYTKTERHSIFNDFYIYEVGIFMGIIIGKSTKKRVLEIMKLNAGIDLNDKKNEPVIYYNDISINFHFDESNIVSELEFGENFKGSTRKGLRIGDTLDKATEIYGEPEIKTAKVAIWDKIIVFYNENLITKLKIQ